MSRYDWSTIKKRFPDVRYVATDKNGEVWGYYDKPIPDYAWGLWGLPLNSKRPAEEIETGCCRVLNWMDTLEEWEDKK